MALETAIIIRAGITIVEKLFIDNQEICYNRFNFFWPLGEKKEIRVLIAVKKDLKNKIMIDHKTYLIYHLYFMLLKICKLNPQ